MRFEEVLEGAERLLREDRRREKEGKPAKGVATSVRELARDARFAGVVALVKRNLEGYQKVGALQVMAGDHGKLAHCQGCVFALDELLTHLEGMVDLPRKGRDDGAEGNEKF